MGETSKVQSTIFVGGLGSEVNQDSLRGAFEPFGTIIEITLPKAEKPNSPDPHRGFGYVEFEEVDEAKEAIYNMDQSEFFGRIIKVATAKPQKEQNEGLGSRTAVWEQEGYLATHAVDDEDRLAIRDEADEENNRPADPMQGLEGLDVAGPKPV